jgi:chromosome segregation and condensation protein ScpB
MELALTNEQIDALIDAAESYIDERDYDLNDSPDAQRFYTDEDRADWAEKRAQLQEAVILLWQARGVIG